MVGEQSHESYGTIPPSVSHPREDEEERDPLTTEDMADESDVFAEGKCPWCDEYEGEYPERHAAKAHTEEYKEWQ